MGGTTSLDTILGQCMYFGLSFSRVGTDFRALMMPIFLKVSVQNFANAIAKVTRQFEMDMENYTLINKVTLNSISNIGKSNQDNFSPPETLLNFQPLALYCNGMLTAFNDLKQCSPIAIVHEATGCVQKSLECVALNIVSFYNQEQQALDVKERDIFVKFCCSFAFDLVPYLQRCIHDIFPVSVLTMHLGINALALQQNGLSYLNKSKILEGLTHLLPEKIETIIKEVAEMKCSDQVDESRIAKSEDGDTPKIDE